VRHVTSFRYEPAVRESVMEVRMQPRSEANQRAQLPSRREPSANITQYRDFAGNTVHHFDIADLNGSKSRPIHRASRVCACPAPSEAGDWARPRYLERSEDHWRCVAQSFRPLSEALEQLLKELRCERRGSPLER